MSRASTNLLTGYNIGANIRQRWDERKKQEGMKEAVSAVQDPRIQTQQEQMLEQQTQGFDDQDAQQWRPTSADWGNMRINGAKKILDSGGSLDDVQKFQKYVDDKQKNGIQKYANLAASALEQGNVDAAARYMDVGYGYMDDGVLLQSANVDGKLMAFPKNEQTGELMDTPVPLTPDAIRRQAQAFTNNDAFLRWSWGKNKFDKEFPLQENADRRAEDANKRANELHPAQVRKLEADTARQEQPTYSVAGSSTGKGSVSTAAGWKTTDLNSVNDDLRKTFASYNLESQTYAGVPRNKEEIYKPENAPNTQALTYGLVDVNPGISAGTAISAGEKLAQLRLGPKEKYDAFMKKNGRPNPNSPSGFSVRIHNQDFNLPIRLAPDKGKAANAWAAKKGISLTGSGPVLYQSKPGLKNTQYGRKYELGGNNPATPQQAIPPRPAAQGSAPQQAIPQQAAPPPQQAVPQQQAAPQQAPTTPQQQAVPPGPGIPQSALPPAGSPRGQHPEQQANDKLSQNVMDQLLEWQNPYTGIFEVDMETLKQYERKLAGVHSRQADRIRTLIKQIKQQGQNY